MCHIVDCYITVMSQKLALQVVFLLKGGIKKWTVILWHTNFDTVTGKQGQYLHL